MGVRLITFATREFQESADRLVRSAANFGLECTVYTPAARLVRDLRRRHPVISRGRRGYGYWLWKPALVADELSRAADGDVIFYCDAGADFVADPAPLVDLARRHEIVVFRQSAPASEWTRRDCFVLMGADEERYWNAAAAVAGYVLFCAGARARAFAAEWLEACSDPRILTDAPNVMGRENLPGYRDHRHDQSVLGILAERHALPHFPDPSQYGYPHVGATYGQVIDSHRSRKFTLRNRLGRATLPLRQALIRASRALLRR
jgi:hypothetical protein